MLIHYCKTLYCCLMTLPSSSTTSATLSKCTPLTKVDWSELESLRRDRQSVFFTAVNPMDARQDLKKLNTIWTNPESNRRNLLGKITTTQYQGLQFYQTRSHVIILSGTLPAIRLEKVVCMKTGEELYCKVHQSPRLPRVTLVPNSQHSRKDLPITDSRKSHDCESEEHEHRETCSSGRVDFQIPSIPHSTVEQVETSRKETVKRLVEQFEKSPKQENVAERHCEAGGDQPFQSRRNFRVLRDLFEEKVSRLRLVLGNWCRKLHMRKMRATY